MSKEQYNEFPEEYTRRELNARYREIPLKDTTSRLLRKYFNAMANLYGIIPLHKAKEIIFSLSPKLVTEDEFLAFAEIARHECEGYYILGGDELYSDVKHTKLLEREIIDVSLTGETINLFTETKHSQEYNDPFYCEDTPEKTALRLFMEEQLDRAVTEWKTPLTIFSTASDLFGATWKAFWITSIKGTSASGLTET